MDADESCLDMEMSDFSEEITKIQALIRGTLVRQQMAEIRELYEKIVQSIDGDETEVGWPSFSLSKPVIRKRSRGHAIHKHSEINQRGKQSIAISEHKSISSVCKSWLLSGKKDRARGKQNPVQSKVIVRRTGDFRRKTDDNGDDEEELLVEYVQIDGANKEDKRVDQCGKPTNESDAPYSMTNGAGTSEQRSVEHFYHNVDDTALQDKRGRGNVEDKAGVSVLPYVEDEAQRSSTGFNSQTVDLPEKMGEKQFSCAEVQTDEYTNKSEDDNEVGRPESPYPEVPRAVGRSENPDPKVPRAGLTDPDSIDLNKPREGQQTETDSYPHAPHDIVDEMFADQERTNKTDEDVKSSCSDSSNRQDTEYQIVVPHVNGKTLSIGGCLVSKGNELVVAV
ncbi:IQ domain-containing protein C [Elysia marginata]|uniref:IQ domain-containing protein C n=1 Tax=Elysia marginata TaxID=1093978 RepID=A0AAV4HSI8_9GAST|nr:IQ domain-containing protein C [Elysia marginata]